MPIVRTLRFVWSHPLNRGRRARGVVDYLRWQVGSRLVPGPVVAPFVDDTRLVVEPGMTGATGNLYVGLHELEEMAFVLHYLRPDDLFADVGANVGSYTVLAAGAVGARAVAFEPIPATYARLMRNVAINGLASRVEAHNVGVGRSHGTLTFTAHGDTINHVLAAHERVPRATVVVDVVTLDAVFAERTPAIVKVDVEGFEAEVLAGADRLLDRPELAALVIELAPGRGYDVASVDREILARGFVGVRYAPLDGRRLEPRTGVAGAHGNALYVRDLAASRTRIAGARRYAVHGTSL